MVYRLSSGQASISVDPTLGASILSYHLSDGRPILRPVAAPKDGLSSACYLLLPWCNRIDGGVTSLDGSFTQIAPTHTDHPLPIHGSAALSEWQVEAADEHTVSMSLNCDWPKPFRYRSEVRYVLEGSALTIFLSAQHLGETALPYGLGLHPWFVRTPATKLQTRAINWQRTDARQIPIETVDLCETPEWNFNHSRALPAGLIDTAFGGWSGSARLQIDESLAVDISTDPILEYFHIYSTGKGCGFVCFEPVNHPVNAHNMQGHPGLTVLEPNESVTISTTIRPISLA